MYITGAAPKTGFSGEWFGNGFTHPDTGESYPGDAVYKRRNKMIYTDEPTGKTPAGLPPHIRPQPYVDWIFERIDPVPATEPPTPTEVCVRFWVGKIQPAVTPDDKLMGAKVASGEATPEEAAAHADWWNQRIEYLFENADTIVEGYDGACPPWSPPPPPPE